MTKYVTRKECEVLCGSLKVDFNAIKDALIGPDLQSGLVAEVKALRNDVNRLIESRRTEQLEQKTKKYTSTKYKIAFLGFAFTLLGIFLNHFLRLLG